MIAAVSKLYREAEEWAFTASIKSDQHGLKSRRYSYDDKPNGNRHRAKLIKALKADGFTVMMVN